MKKNNKKTTLTIYQQQIKTPTNQQHFIQSTGVGAGKGKSMNRENRRNSRSFSHRSSLGTTAKLNSVIGMAGEESLHVDTKTP